MMVDKSSSSCLVHLRIGFAVYSSQKEPFQDVESCEKVEDEYHAENEGAVGGQLRYRLQRDMLDMGALPDVESRPVGFIVHIWRDDGRSMRLAHVDM